MATVGYADAARRGLQQMMAIDETILVRVRRSQVPWGTALASAFTRAGDPAGWLIHAGLMLICLGPSDTRAAGVLAIGALCGVAASQAIKRLVKRSRPRKGIAGFEVVLDDPDQFSFPSGHTTVAFAVVVALSAVSPTLALAELPFAAAIAVSRVYLGAHYPLDVAAGIVAGTAAGSAAIVACGALPG